MSDINRIVETHPALVVLAFTIFFGVMNVLLGITIQGLKWFVTREFEALQSHQDRQDVSIRSMEDRLDDYDVTFALSKGSFETLVGKIDKHIDKEDQLPAQVTKIAEDVAWIKGRIQNGGGR